MEFYIYIYRVALHIAAKYYGEYIEKINDEPYFDELKMIRDILIYIYFNYIFNLYIFKRNFHLLFLMIFQFIYFFRNINHYLCQNDFSNYGFRNLNELDAIY